MGTNFLKLWQNEDSIVLREPRKLGKILNKEMEKGGSTLTDLEKNRIYSLEEFFLLVGEKRTELYEGVPVFMAPAAFEHEGVIANVIGELKLALKGSKCLVFGSNLQVVLPFRNEKKGKDNVTVLPDISIVCDKSKLRNKRCYGAPDLVVEVLSASTARNDRLLKYRYYEKAGVREYLIIDYANRLIETNVLHDEVMQLEQIFDEENPAFESTVFPEITFSLNEIFSFLD